MKIKTQYLTDSALDWSVAKSEGVKFDEGQFTPSNDWSQGGPIIERERIKVEPNLGGSWLGQIRHEKYHPLVSKPVLAGWTTKRGPTPLIAAMRCFVASKMGDEVEIPEELI